MLPPKSNLTASAHGVSAMVEFAFTLMLLSLAFAFGCIGTSVLLVGIGYMMEVLK